MDGYHGLGYTEGYPVQSNTIRNWVQQFAADGFVAEAHQILVYMLQYGFVTETIIVEELVRLYNVLVNASNRMPVSVAIQKPGKSEQKLAYRLRPTILMDSLAGAITYSKSRKDRENRIFIALTIVWEVVIAWEGTFSIRTAIRCRMN